MNNYQQFEDDIYRMEQDHYNVMINIGAYCKHYRLEVLKKTRAEITDEVQPQTLAHFENGLSTNMKHYIRYYHACDTPAQQQDFMKGIHEIIKENPLYG